MRGSFSQLLEIEMSRQSLEMTSQGSPVNTRSKVPEAAYDKLSVADRRVTTGGMYRTLAKFHGQP